MFFSLYLCIGGVALLFVFDWPCPRLKPIPLSPRECKANYTSVEFELRT